jgi:hypothetical protein
MEREWAYLIKIEDENSEAGTYASAAGGVDGPAVKAGQGVRGRITGGTVVASTEKEAKEKIQLAHNHYKRSPVTQEDGSVKEVVELITPKIHFIDINGRGVIISSE